MADTEANAEVDKAQQGIDGAVAASSSVAAKVQRTLVYTGPPDMHIVNVPNRDLSYDDWHEVFGDWLTANAYVKNGGPHRWEPPYAGQATETEGEQ